MQLDPIGWDRPNFTGSGGKAPYEVEDLKMAIEADPAPPVRPYDQLKAKTVKEVRPGVYILDFGQNLAGFAHLKVRGENGQRITLRFAEALNSDGTIYTTNLRGARATDHYICRGNGVEEWSPRFTFHGFQYVEVSGLGHAPKAGGDEIVALAISSATPESGRFECSDPMINQLSHNAWWTQKMNFIDVPTDCPQRDERLGWTGDAQAYIRTASMYSDVQPFFAKWLQSLEDDQRADGQFPMVAPLKVAEDDGGPAWADAGVICPWTIYDVYGDKRQLADRYESMKRFVEFCRARSKPDLLPPDRFHCFGDWLSINANTPNEVIYEAYFAGSARLLAQS
ncbi:alpha-L-rhamnosidase, partial [bacterium]